MPLRKGRFCYAKRRSKYRVAVRRELVIDECGGATRRRRQAHA